MKLGSIQLLRAVAAILVVYAHSIDLTMRFSKPFQGNFYYLNDWGCIGVDLFFVISGFIICYVTNQQIGYQKAVLFLKRRFYRINPVYYIASLLFLVIILASIWLSNNPMLINSYGILHSLIDTLLIVPTSATQFYYKPILSISWTLAFEWLFYAFSFLAIILRINNKVILLGPFILLLATLYFLIQPTDLRLTFITNPIMLEFVLGLIIYQVYQKVRKIPFSISIILLITGLVWYIILIFYNFPSIAAIGTVLTGSLSMERFLCWGIPSSFIVAGCIYLEKEGKFNQIWHSKTGQLLGDASYSIYLIHFIIFFIVNILYSQVGFFLHPDTSIFLQLVLALGFCVAFYWWVEKPLTRKLAEPPTSSQLPTLSPTHHGTN